MSYKYVDLAALKKFKTSLLALFKTKTKLIEVKYNYTVATTINNPAYSIGTFDSTSDAIDVYVNGFRLISGTEFSTITSSGSTSVSIIGTLTAGTKVSISIKRLSFSW